MSFPKYSTEPSCIVHRPNMLFRSVLFPPPFGPTITVIPFLIASKSTPNSILLCPYPDFIFFTLINHIFKKIREVAEKQNVTFLIIEHRLDISLEYSDHVFALDGGRIIAQGDSDEILKHPAVIESYLGE